jgi:hypothetical protein
MAGPSKADMMSLCDGARNGQLGLPSPLFRLPCGVILHLHLHFGGSASASGSCMLPSCGSLSTSHLAMPCVWGANASDFAVMALLALLAGLTPVVPLARAGAVPMTSSAVTVRPPCQSFIRSYASGRAGR